MKFPGIVDKTKKEGYTVLCNVLKGVTFMLAKWWKRIGFLILIVACLFNITSKLVKRVSFNDNVKSTVSNTVNTVKEKVTPNDTNNNVKEENN